MFDFRIIICADGLEIIDTSLKTPYETLTAVQMVKYVETDVQLAYMDRMKRKAMEQQARRRKISRNPLWRLACLCGLV